MNNEAIKRLEWLVSQGVWVEALNKFKEGHPCVVVPMDVEGDLTGVTFTFDEKPELKAIKDDFEKKYRTVVYYGIFNRTPFGDFLTLLFVDKTEEEWEMDMEDLKAGYPLAYVYNFEEEFGEIGEINFKVGNGGLIRRGYLMF